MSVRGSLALVLSVFGWPDRSFGWLDRSRFVDRRLSFFLSLVRRIGALGGWIDRGLWIVRSCSFSRSFTESELWVVGSIGVCGSLALVLSLARWPDRSSGWLDRSELSHLISLVGIDLVRWLDLIRT